MTENPNDRPAGPCCLARLPWQAVGRATHCLKPRRQPRYGAAHQYDPKTASLMPEHGYARKLRLKPPQCAESCQTLVMAFSILVLDTW
jgi:hypothetical protein